jgi:hypothetical protein
MNSTLHPRPGRRPTGTDGERVLDWLVLRPDLPPMQTLIVGEQPACGSRHRMGRSVRQMGDQQGRHP